VFAVQLVERGAMRCVGCLRGSRRSDATAKMTLIWRVDLTWDKVVAAEKILA